VIIGDIAIDDMLDLQTTVAIHCAVYGYRTHGDASVKLYLSQLAECTSTTKRI